MSNLLGLRKFGLCLPCRAMVLSTGLLVTCSPGPAQTPSDASPQRTASYSLSVSVNEVEIAFHAADAHDLPVLDLKPEDVDVLDDGTGPGKIIQMKLVQDQPVHLAIVVDTSGSVAAQVARNRLEAQEAVQKLLVKGKDAGAVIAFGRSRHLLQGWTSQKKGLIRAISEIGVGKSEVVEGTGLYDTLFSTCLYELGKDELGKDEFGGGEDKAAAKVIFLFSDGVDTASHTTIELAVDRCRKSRTAVYAFGPAVVQNAPSLGPSVLRQIAEQTGGRAFFADGGGGDDQADIDIAVQDLSSEYLLLYRPKKLNHDGTFHRIVLVGPKRVRTIVGTSGFYDPAMR